MERGSEKANIIYHVNSLLPQTYTEHLLCPRHWRPDGYKIAVGHSPIMLALEHASNQGPRLGFRGAMNPLKLLQRMQNLVFIGTYSVGRNRLYIFWEGTKYTAGVTFSKPSGIPKKTSKHKSQIGLL